MRWSLTRERQEGEWDREKEGNGESKSELWFSLYNRYYSVDQNGAVEKQKFKGFLIKIFFRLAFG